MFIYIVINENNYPVGSFVDINDARTHKNINYKIIKSTLVGELPDNKLRNQFKKASNDLQKGMPDELKGIFGMKM